MRSETIACLDYHPACLLHPQHPPLPATHPHEIERPLRKLERQGVHDAERDVVQPRVGRELRRADDLHGREGDALHLGAREFGGQDAGSAPDAAPDVQDAARGGGGSREGQHRVDEVDFRGFKVFLQVARPALSLRVVAQVDVLAPIVLQDALTEESGEGWVGVNGRARRVRPQPPAPSLSPDAMSVGSSRWEKEGETTWVYAGGGGGEGGGGGGKAEA